MKAVLRERVGRVGKVVVERRVEEKEETRARRAD